MKQNDLSSLILTLLSLTLGTFLLAAGLMGFQEPNMIAPGGVTGFAVVLKELTNIPIYITNIAVNVPLFIIGIIILGKNFGWKTLYCTLLLSLFLKITPSNALTEDLLLASIFGGVITGIGLGIVFKAGGTTGGTDLAGAILNKIFPNLSTAKFMAAIDTLVVIFAGLVDQKIETSLYSLIALFITTRLIDTFLEGIGYLKAFTIITNYPDEISDKIMKDLDRGVTFFKGKGAYTKSDKDVLLCVVNRYQFTKVQDIVSEMDEDAFMMVTDVSEVLGEGFKQIGGK